MILPPVFTMDLSEVRLEKAPVWWLICVLQTFYRRKSGILTKKASILAARDGKVTSQV